MVEITEDYAKLTVSSEGYITCPVLSLRPCGGTDEPITVVSEVFQRVEGVHQVASGPEQVWNMGHDIHHVACICGPCLDPYREGVE